MNLLYLLLGLGLGWFGRGLRAQPQPQPAAHPQPHSPPAIMDHTGWPQSPPSIYGPEYLTPEFAGTRSAKCPPGYVMGFASSLQDGSSPNEVMYSDWGDESAPEDPVCIRRDVWDAAQQRNEPAYEGPQYLQGQK